MKTFTLFILVALAFQEAPFRPNETFDVKLEYEFKQRPASDKTAIHFDETEKEQARRTSTSLLPYLAINVKVLEVAEGEVRVKVSNNMDRTSYSRKIQNGAVIRLDMGFTDDIKDRITAHEYNLTFLSSDKQALSRIHIFIGEDGSFLVNGEKRGKF